jgi:hypothetical protein
MWMVTDQQVRKLRKLLSKGYALGMAGVKADMGESAAHKYMSSAELPSEMSNPHTWRTREDPFVTIWEEVRNQLEVNPGLEGKSLFEYLQRQYPGRFSDGQVRTFQRRVKVWKALEGKPKEVFFAQVYIPGELSESDFTWMNELGICIAGQPFDHLVYHFVLPYSNWETGSVCFSECFESLSMGLQNALWDLDGVTEAHQTDRLSAAVRAMQDPEQFTQAYRGLLRHYGMQPKATQANSPNENGDVEQRHHRFKRAVDQALMLRGSRDFSDRPDYEAFLKDLFAQLNAGRKERFAQEQPVLGRLPAHRLEACSTLPQIKVTGGSTISVKKNVYSVDSRLVGEAVKVKVYPETLEVWYAQRCVESIPRLRGEGKHRINYRHIITWLVRKPGAFEHYRYREDLFPSMHFRWAYDYLKAHHAQQKASKEYLQILQLAAVESESKVDEALECSYAMGTDISFDGIKEIVDNWKAHPTPTLQVSIPAVLLRDYDELLLVQEAAG